MTHSSLFNENWFRVQALTPRLAPDVVVSRHIYRLQPNYILRRKSTRRWHRMSAAAYELLVQFDGQNTVAQVWESLLESQAEQAPDQSDVINLLSQLHDADMLVVDDQLDARLLLDRQERLKKSDNRQRLWNPLHIRISLFDPDIYLDRLDSLIPRRCFLPLMIGMFLLLALAGVVLAPQWPELVQHLRSNTVFDPANIVLLAIMYPLMKLVHELAHGLIVKRFGGEVRECGVAMLVLFPNPYVDASAASMFADKYQRILVSAAGIAVELCLAAIAVLVWSSTTGLVRDAALSVMVIGSVSTLLFNGNPLLKFDGYYILSDWLEIPNLASRSRQYLLGSLARMIKIETSSIPVPTDTREKFWLVTYGILATAYRLLLMALIAWMVSGEYFFFGILLALYIAFMMLILPLWKLWCFISAQTPQAKGRLAMAIGGLTLLVAGVATAMPGSGAITTDGIVWLPEQSVLRLEQACEVVNVATQPGTMVTAGQHLFDCADDAWLAKERALDAELRKIDAQRAGLLTRDPVEHERLTNQRTAISDEYELAKRRLSSMKVTAAVGGQFLVDENVELAGRYIPANIIAGYVVPPEQRTIRVALTQLQMGYLSDGFQAAQVFFVDDNAEIQIAESSVSRLTPKATRSESVMALTTLGGGHHRAELTENGALLEQAVFDVELTWPEELSAQLIGSRLRVRIEHRSTSFPQLINDHIRSLLLRRAANS